MTSPAETQGMQGPAVHSLGVQRSRSLLLVTNYTNTHSAQRGGRELLCALNHTALQRIYGERLRVFHLQRRPAAGFRQRAASLQGHVDGVSAEMFRILVELIRRENVEKVFIDGSNLGPCARAVKRLCPGVEVISFFHNVEVRFFAGALQSSRSLRAVAVMGANYLAERQAVLYSDKRICLSTRDSKLLRKLYGCAATHISPLAVVDRLPEGHATNVGTERAGSALFVGGMFYANLQGIRWFVEQVLPRVNIDLYVVGRGFEAYRAELESRGRVKVVGGVDSVADWYAGCGFVVAPIFDGSGMKTKVAEALMFGKRIVGTPEAFSGYEEVADHAGWVCSTPDDFMRAIESARVEALPAFAPDLRSLYEQHYSFESAVQRLARIVGPLSSKVTRCAG